jgi:nucleoside-triphosphatase
MQVYFSSIGFACKTKGDNVTILIKSLGCSNIIFQFFISNFLLHYSLLNITLYAYFCAMIANIIILCDAVQSGKTTALHALCAHYKNIGGFTTPDIDGLRNLYAIETNTYYALQKKTNSDASDIAVGKFVFDAEIFAKARNIIAGFASTKKQILIVDEIGILELNGAGLEPQLGVFLLQQQFAEGRLIILVVRDYLLQTVIEKYKLQLAQVLNVQQFNTYIFAS